jgi:hypothetical protein
LDWADTTVMHLNHRARCTPSKLMAVGTHPTATAVVHTAVRAAAPRTTDCNRSDAVFSKALPSSQQLQSMRLAGPAAACSSWRQLTSGWHLHGLCSKQMRMAQLRNTSLRQPAQNTWRGLGPQPDDSSQVPEMASPVYIVLVTGAHGAHSKLTCTRLLLQQRGHTQPAFACRQGEAWHDAAVQGAEHYRALYLPDQASIICLLDLLAGPVPAVSRACNGA